jgi:riboflavin-specific deaminase-like protein
MEFLDRWLAETGTVPTDRPLVTLSYAQTLDGSISLRSDQGLAISGEQSRMLTHKLRASHDAILVGIGTVLSDDPQLNVRLVEGTDPQVVILDSNLRLPISSKLLTAVNKPWVFCASLGSKENQVELEKAGVKIEKQTDASGRVDLHKMLRRLKDLDINTLMVEGGGEVIGAFLSNGLVDRLMLTIAPKMIDGYKVPLNLEQPLRLIDTRMEQAGEDIIVLGKFH